MSTEGGSPGIKAVAALGDDLRRAMYGYVRHCRRPVTRDDVAVAVGISRKLAAFHLDKLVTAGLLRARYEPVGGVRKVGRTPKVYEPADGDIRISIPGRQHDVLADILLEAVLTEGDGERARDAAVRVAAERGQALGTAMGAQAGPGQPSSELGLALAEGVLARHGFEPSRAAPGLVRLRNCPFHPFAAKAPDLVCAINHAFLSGLLTGLDAAGVQAVLRPTAGECCVQLQAAGESGQQADRRDA